MWEGIRCGKLNKNRDYGAHSIGWSYLAYWVSIQEMRLHDVVSHFRYIRIRSFDDLLHKVEPYLTRTLVLVRDLL